MSSPESNTNQETTIATSNRREFFKKVLFYTSAGAAIQVLAKTRLFAADAPALKPAATDPSCKAVAGGLGYVDDLAAGLKAKKITKKDMPAGAKTWKTTEQMCSNCALFNMQKKTPAEPSCGVMPGCAVNPKGSCNSWAPKTT